ncbi:class I SAM-dependent methyltransferase [Actinomycetaceae bacterium WB03_NA08]|uniref:Class I SAM-dependent methyltransferase n=1 Tax=Scrofimicrobium canadense TaxID=2652290 RepID=A0A6N7VQI3_9ACTO|nr:class I SAM-dependent methyltransferase [Scrofimicrobium canadense]MSS83994.1 class I SAM-dependent methyltransferase [Scrofimicrobium canadense]
MSNRYTHGHHESVLRSHRSRTVENSAAYLLPFLNDDVHLLDIGAGPGTITADFAEKVKHVTATEIGIEQLSLSKQTMSERQISNVSFAVENVEKLSFPDDSFDVVHAHQVLQHVSDPVQALREMRRVMRPGGIVAVRDSDYAGFVWYPAAPMIDKWLHLYSTVARLNGGEPDAGRRLLSWAQQAGFADIQASSSTWCYSTEAERQWWAGLWAERITESSIAKQLVDHGLASTDDLRAISDGWLQWAEADDGWFSVFHGEILAR